MLKSNKLLFCSVPVPCCSVIVEDHISTLAPVTSRDLKGHS